MRRRIELDACCGFNPTHPRLPRVEREEFQGNPFGIPGDDPFDLKRINRSKVRLAEQGRCGRRGDRGEATD
jgi:hypothetical protein